MLGEIRKCPGIPVITVESTEKRHQEIILTTITKRAQQIFEERECKQGFELDDWLNAEKELWRDNDLNAAEFSLVVDAPKDPDVTTVLSLTAHSLVVFRNRRSLTMSALSNPFLNRPLHSVLRVVFLVASLTSASTTTARS